MTNEGITEEDTATGDHESGPAKSGKKITIWGIVFLGAVVVAAVAFFIFTRPSPLESAHETCREEADGLASYSMSDDEITLTGAYMSGNEISEALGRDQASAFECLVDELEIPSRVTADMESTNSMQGQRSAEWDDFAAHWSYHPDQGLDLLIERP